MFNSIVQFTIKGQRYTGWIVGYGPLDAGVDVETQEYIVFENKIFPELNCLSDFEFYHPKVWDDVNIQRAPTNEVLMNRVHLPWSAVSIVPTEAVAEKVRERLANQNLVFRRVHTAHKRKDMGTFKYDYCEFEGETKSKCTHHDIEAIPAASSAHNQKNAELQYRKRYILEKGEYYGFTTPRALRKADRCNTSVYFNTSSYFEYNVFTDKWERPDHNTAHQLPYAGDLVCGTVVMTDKGPSFDKFFVCSEQFMKFVTLVLDPEHESIEENHAKLYNRLRTNKFGEWLRATPDATESEMQERYHRFRYEKTASVQDAYTSIAFLSVLQEPEYVTDLAHSASIIQSFA